MVPMAYNLLNSRCIKKFQTIPRYNRIDPSTNPTAISVSLSLRHKQDVLIALLGKDALEILTHTGCPWRSNLSKFQTFITGLTPTSSSCTILKSTNE